MRTLTTTTLPAGWYAIGDPCHLLRDTDYDELHLLRRVQPEQEGFTLACGTRIAVLNTGGDGWLIDSEGDLYGIDTGSLAICPLRAADGLAVDEMARRGLGTAHEFGEPFQVAAEPWDTRYGIPRAGSFHARIGPISIIRA